MGELYVIRHAQASFGQADYDRLSELGFRQASLLEAFFSRIGTRFQSIYSGSLKRQVATAESLQSRFRADVPHQELSILPEFNEYDSSLKMALSLSDRETIQLSWQVRNASVSTFKYNRDRLTLSSFNNVAHLEIKREPGLLTYR